MPFPGVRSLPFARAGRGPGIGLGSIDPSQPETNARFLPSSLVHDFPGSLPSHTHRYRTNPCADEDFVLRISHVRPFRDLHDRFRHVQRNHRRPINPIRTFRIRSNVGNRNSRMNPMHVPFTPGVEWTPEPGSKWESESLRVVLLERSTRFDPEVAFWFNQRDERGISKFWHARVPSDRSSIFLSQPR